MICRGMTDYAEKEGILSPTGRKKTDLLQRDPGGHIPRPGAPRSRLGGPRGARDVILGSGNDFIRVSAGTGGSVHRIRCQGCEFGAAARLGGGGVAVWRV